jgi:8-oxo-dGTP pyrophosphatase MutT (NUDIX family)
MVVCQTLHGQERLVAPAQLCFRPSVYALIPHHDANALITIRSTGTYGLPGGAVEPHESLEQALVREVREETGLVVSVERLLHFKETFFYYEPSDSAWHTLSFFFGCRPESVTLATDQDVQDDEFPEASRPRWVSTLTLPPEDIQHFFADVIALWMEGVS